MAELNVRDRIVEMVRVSSSELVGNDANFRVHPAAQKNAFSAVLEEVGIAGALIAYHSDRNDGQLTLIDGHMRAKGFEGEWPVLVTDLTDEEADKLLLAYDPVSHMAVNNKRMLEDLRSRAKFKDASIQVMLDELQNLDASGTNDEKSGSGSGSGEKEKQDEGKSIPEMELQPYEHYDYMMIVCRTTFDWNWLSDRFELSKVDGSNDSRVTKIGLGRVIAGDKVIARMKVYEDQLAAAKQFISECDELSDEAKNDMLQRMEEAASGKEQY
jgi:hypothetical protein